jgi:5-methylcytosine-specific restriction endonuclease McrA
MTDRRRDAVYCSRRCKTAASDQRRIADGRSRGRDTARYAASEGDHRREYARGQSRELREAVLSHYGTTCAICGSGDDIELDHVHGNGERHRDIVGHGDAFYRYLLRASFPAECEPGGEFELQLLCRPCHLEKTNTERKERG